MGVPYQLSREGPANDEITLIGIELAATPNGRREVELEMYGFKHTMPNYPYDQSRLRVTVHTSNGDITATFPLRVGNHQAY